MKRSILTLMVLLVLCVAIPAVAEVPDVSGPEAVSVLAVLSHPAGTVQVTAADAARFDSLEAPDVARLGVLTTGETIVTTARRVDARSRTVQEAALSGGTVAIRYVLLC